MDKPVFNKKELQEIQKGYREVRDLAKKYGYEMSIVEGLTRSVKKNMADIVNANREGTGAAKAEKKFREQSNDLTKEVLENVRNIGTEEFKTFDVSKKLAIARRKGYKTAVAQLEIAKRINKEQQLQNKQIQNLTAIAKKPFESIDAFIRQIPVLGDMLADFADFGGMGDNLAGGIIEGFTSGFVENADLAGKTADMIKNSTDKGLIASFNKSGIAMKGMKVGLVGVAVLAAQAAAKMMSFANETGISYNQTLGLGGALLVNSEAVRTFADELGTVNNLTTAQAFTLKIQEKRYGLSARSAATLFAVERSISGASMDTFLSLTKSTAELARQSGVAPKAVFDDMAQNAEAIAKFSGESTESMRDAAIHAKSMGLGLSNTSKMAESLLNWEQSINDQMEASMLLGKTINMDKARELMFTGQIDAMQREVVNQVRSMGDFNQLNVAQKEALAKLTGQEVRELAKMADPTLAAADAAEKQKAQLMGAMAAGAAAGAVLLGAFMALRAVFSGGLSLVKDIGLALGGAAAGATVGGGLGAIGGGIYAKAMNSFTDADMPQLASGGVIVGEAGPEVVAPLPNQGVNVDNSGMEKRMDALLEQNEFLLNRLTNRIGDMSLT